MIDTGAAKSAVSESMLLAAGARRLRRELFKSVNHAWFDAWVYRGAILVWGDPPNQVQRAFDVDFAGLPHDDGSPYHGVLGRDFLRDKQLMYDGVSGRFGITAT